jgi:uncharacterized membrane protein YccC
MNMIPNEAKNQFHEIITHEMFEINRTLEGKLDATSAEMAVRGLGQSGPAMMALVHEATNSLKARGHFILGQLLRCLTAHRVTLDPKAVTEASTLLREAIERQAQRQKAADRVGLPAGCFHDRRNGRALFALEHREHKGLL